jgi:hypothetical protein
VSSTGSGRVSRQHQKHDASLGRLTSPLAVHAFTHGPIALPRGIKIEVVGVVLPRFLVIAALTDGFAPRCLRFVPSEVLYGPILTALVAPRERSRDGKIADFKAVKGLHFL